MARQLIDAAIFAIDQGIERIDSALLNVRGTRPKELAIATKRALIAYRHMRLGESMAFESFPELELEQQGRLNGEVLNGRGGSALEAPGT